MSLETLINVAKCPTCENMVPVGRLRPEQPRKCDACKRQIAKIKNRIKCRNTYRKKHIKKCIRCGNDVTFTGGWRKEVCQDCQMIIRDRYRNQTCIYCDSPLSNITAKFCNNKCRNKTFIILNGRKKNVD